MSDELKRIVDEHTVDIAKLKEVTKVHEQRHDSTDVAVAELRESERAILERLGATATKDDIISVKTHVSESVQGILRDALNAIPASQANHIAEQNNRIASRGNMWLAVAAWAGLMTSGIGFIAFVVERLFK